MNEQEKVLAGMIVAALNSGYKITIEHDAISAVSKHGTNVHITYVDELLDEFGGAQPWEYINKKLEEMNG